MGIVSKPSLYQAMWVLTCVLLLTAFYGCSAPQDQDNKKPAVAATQQAAPLKLQRVVMMMRHSVRPPTRSYVIPKGYFSDPWPHWDAKPGYLTEHGFKGAILLGQWNRHELARRGLLPASGCPTAGSVVVWADTDQRTRRTGVGFVQGLAPDCAIKVGYSSGDRDDPMFDPFENLAVPYDQAKGKAAVLAPVGGTLAGLGGISKELDKEFARLSKILGCCSLPLCKASGLPGGCNLGQIHYVWEEGQSPHDEADFVGPLSVGGTAAESILLEYANGKPMQDVGWGRASIEDLTLLSRIHAVEFRVLQRVPYHADRGSTPFMERVLKVFSGTDPALLTVLVGHDTNVAHIGGAMDLHWEVPGYARDDQAINGSVGFELLSDAEGNQFVRAFYMAQGLRQLRELQPLDAQHPAYFEYLAQPECAVKGDPQLCTLAGFEKAVHRHLVH